MRRWVRAALLFAVLLMSCATAAPFSSASALARKLGCDRRQDRTDEVQRRNGVETQTCYIDAHRLVISVFESEATQDRAIAGLQARVDADPDLLIVGDRFLVVTQDRTLADQILDAVGGRVEQT